MADIKQAAKWMVEGKKVTRAFWKDPGTHYCGTGRIYLFWKQRGSPDPVLLLWTGDLLADDWEIADV